MINSLGKWHIAAGKPFGDDFDIIPMSEAVGQLLLEHRVLTGKFRLGDPVRKKSGAEWSGRVVGFYSTRLTPEGYCVESEHHPGSVQIYPVGALELIRTEGN